MKTRSQIEDMVRTASDTRNVMTFLCENNLDPDKVNRAIHHFKYLNSSEWVSNFSKAGYITQMTAREQLTDFCKLLIIKILYLFKALVKVRSIYHLDFSIQIIIVSNGDLLLYSVNN